MDITKICVELGAARVEKIPAEKLVFDRELRKLCESNACGRFSRNYTCPPYAGDIDVLIARLRSYSQAVIWQNIYALEDSFDFEGMMDAQKKHNEVTLKVAESVYAEFGRGRSLALGAGGCSLCQKCGLQTGETCRHPDSALSSLESYGIHVSKTCEALGMSYTNGKDTVTYFSGVFWRK